MTDQIALSFPGKAEYARLARLAAADAGGRAGLDVEAIDDLRVAVTELCAIVAGGSEVATTLELTVSQNRVEVRGAGGAASPSADTEYAEALIAALTDEYSIDHDGERTTFRLVKQSTPENPPTS